MRRCLPARQPLLLIRASQNPNLKNSLSPERLPPKNTYASEQQPQTGLHTDADAVPLHTGRHFLLSDQPPHQGCLIKPRPSMLHRIPSHPIAFNPIPFTPAISSQSHRCKQVSIRFNNYYALKSCNMMLACSKGEPDVIHSYVDPGYLFT